MLLIDIRSTNASAAEFILYRLKLYLAGRHHHHHVVRYRYGMYVRYDHNPEINRPNFLPPPPCNMILVANMNDATRHTATLLLAPHRVHSRHNRKAGLFQRRKGVSRAQGIPG